jgi:hypothetical protein
VRAKLEAKESELEAVRLRLADAEKGLTKSKAEADTLRAQTASTGLAKTTSVLLSRRISRILSTLSQSGRNFGKINVSGRKWARSNLGFRDQYIGVLLAMSINESWHRLGIDLATYVYKSCGCGKQTTHTSVALDEEIAMTSLLFKLKIIVMHITLKLLAAQNSTFN